MKITLEVEQRSTSMHNGKRYVNATELTLGQLRATATSQAAAREELTNMVRTLVGNIERPEVFEFEGEGAVLFPDVPLDGDHCLSWTSIYLHNGKPGGSTSQSGERSEIVVGLKMHLAQNACDYGDDDSVRRCAEYVPARRTRFTDDAKHEFLRYCAWQRAAKAGEAAGVSDVHRYACEHDKEFYASVGLEAYVPPTVMTVFVEAAS